MWFTTNPKLTLAADLIAGLDKSKKEFNDTYRCFCIAEGKKNGIEQRASDIMNELLTMVKCKQAATSKATRMD